MRRSRLKVDLIFHSFAVMRPTHISKKSIRRCTNLARQTTAILRKPDQFAPIDDGYPFLGAERSGLPIAISSSCWSKWDKSHAEFFLQGRYYFLGSHQLEVVASNPNTK